MCTWRETRRADERWTEGLRKRAWRMARDADEYKDQHPVPPTFDINVLVPETPQDPTGVDCWERYEGVEPADMDYEPMTEAEGEAFGAERDEP